MIINDIRSGGHLKAINYGLDKEFDSKNESSMFNYNRSTVGSSTGFKNAAREQPISQQQQYATNKRSRSIEFDEKQSAVTQLMQECTNRIDHKLS